MRWMMVGALAALLAVAGCGKGNFSQQASAGKANVFRYPITENPTTLDPGRVEDGDTIDMLQQVFEGLVGWSEQSTVEPRLAESWDIQDGGKTYVFKLKKGVKFHNGRELTAEDFKWTIERNCDQNFPTTTASTYLNDIVGALDKIAGKAKEVSGVEVVDPYTLKIRIVAPRPYFLAKLTYPVSFPIAKEAVDGIKPISSAQQMVGTGPFKADQYVEKQITVLSAFKDYHGGAPLIDKIERPVMGDAATRLNKYKSGEIDLVQLERQDVIQLQKDPTYGPQLKPFPRPAIWYIGLAPNAYEPFKDRRVRQAFAMAIDTDTIVHRYLDDLNALAKSIVPEGVPGHRADAKSLPYDPERAKKLLADAGYPGGKGLPKLEMYFRQSRPDIQIVAEAAANMLKENLGVSVSLRPMEWAAYLDKRNRRELPFFHMRWAADYLDPENFLSLMLASYGAENRIGYSNPQFDALCREADSSMDNDLRMKLYAQAEDIVLQDAPWIPVYFQRDYELISPRVSGLRESLFGHLPHTRVKLTATGN